MKTLETLDTINETDEPVTGWEGLANAESPAKNEEVDIKAIMDEATEDLGHDLPDDDLESAETSAEYAATNDEIYKSLFNQLSRDIFIGQANSIPAETLKAKTDSRNILMEIHFTNTLNAQKGEPETPIITALENRKAVYDQMFDSYKDLGEPQLANEYTNLSTRTTELIALASDTKKNIEDKKNPDSTYNQLASQFKGHASPAAPKPSENNAAMFK